MNTQKEGDLCLLKQLVSILRDQGFEPPTNKLSDFIYSIEEDYQNYFDMPQDDWGFSCLDLINAQTREEYDYAKEQRKTVDHQGRLLPEVEA